MTMAALREHPKVYWIWNHRRWCLENVPDGPEVDGAPSLQWRKANWNKELAVIEKMLDADARNCKPLHTLVSVSSSRRKVHAWNYRRYVLASMPDQRPVMTELAYTTRKISASFSNFSAWHQRSKVYAALWKAGELDPIRSRDEGMCLVLTWRVLTRAKSLSSCTTHCSPIQTTRARGSIIDGSSVRVRTRRHTPPHNHNPIRRRERGTAAARDRRHRRVVGRTAR